jgi:hypothetical protein
MKFLNKKRNSRLYQPNHMIENKSPGAQIEQGECCIAAAITVIIKLILEEYF